MPSYLAPEVWLDQIFSSKSALSGGVVRRKVRDVDRLVGRQMFREALRKRGYRAVENNGNFVTSAIARRSACWSDQIFKI